MPADGTRSIMHATELLAHQHSALRSMPMGACTAPCLRSIMHATELLAHHYSALRTPVSCPLSAALMPADGTRSIMHATELLAHQHSALPMGAGTAPCLRSIMHVTELLAHHYSALRSLCLCLCQLL